MLSAATALVLLSGCIASATAVQTRTERFAEAPKSQSFPRFGRCPVAPASRYLPSGAGCVTAREADVYGDRRADLILLYALLDKRGIATGFTLKVERTSGGTLVAHVPRSELNATIARLRNVNSRRGVEIFVHEAHITTEEEMGVYAFDGHALVKAGVFAYGGEDAGIRFGFTCDIGSKPNIVQHEFEEQTPFKGVWKRIDTTYGWDGARLRRGSSQSTYARPTPSEVGAHC